MIRFMLVATVAVALSAAVLPVSNASAAETPTAGMVVTCSEMCGGCVKKVEKRFAEDKGIASVACDIPTKTVVFQAAPGFALNARGIWTAMNKIGKTPVQLVEPNGTVHTKKPD
ncbi:MAG TPA: heavy-metal-associated domain-containing protein [Pirellulaceae bacterium]|nr:heavy-metal-associated domain-containing protein [Pirellulaceae bacterium]